MRYQENFDANVAHVQEELVALKESLEQRAVLNGAVGQVPLASEVVFASVVSVLVLLT